MGERIARARHPKSRDWLRRQRTFTIAATPSFIRPTHLHRRFPITTASWRQRRSGAISRVTTPVMVMCVRLLSGIDDRYVIMNAGDELCTALRRARASARRLGARLRHRRRRLDQRRRLQLNLFQDRAAVSLITHERNTTPRRASSKDDWEYRHHTEDWQTYHTRYVTPDIFDNALRSNSGK